MAVAGGPDIVNDGLVCRLDAANPASNTGSGSIWYDLSGFNNHGTLINSPSFDTTRLGSLVLNGTTQYVRINCPNSTIRVYEDTTEFVVTLPQWSGGQRCILSYRTGGGGAMYVGKAGNGIFSYYNSLQLNGSGAPGYTVGFTPSPSLAHCAVVTSQSGSFVKHYINGSLVGTATRNGGWVANYHSFIALGYDLNGGTNEYMLGNFHSFSHYNRPLSDSEIKQNYLVFRNRYGI